jgi:hypothetical protein
VVRYAVTDEKAQQVTEEGRRIAGLGFTCELERAADFRATTGAPVLDKDGLLVGVVSGKGPGSFEEVRVLSVEPITELLPALRAALK